MPSLFAIGDKVLSNPGLATFAAFGSFALLLLADFGGPMRERLFAQAALGATGAVFIVLGTLASRSAWLATISMAIVGFAVLFAGVVSSVLASAGVSLLLAFILPVSLAAPASAIPDRLAGWGLAAGVSLLAVAFMWPAPARDRLRAAAIQACLALAARLRADVAAYHERSDGGESRREAVERAAAAASGLQKTFYATPYRPSGLSTSARAVVRLVDEIGWLEAIVAQTPWMLDHPVEGDICTGKLAAADVLDQGAALLGGGGSVGALDAALGDLGAARARIEAATSALALAGAPDVSEPERVALVVSALDPGFRVQELGFAAARIAGNIEVAAAADRRSFGEQVLGRMPPGLPGTVEVARRRAVAHLEPHSVWLHNSLRGAAALALAVFIARTTGVQHSFWVVLGTLSVLRSNALGTGQTVVRGLVGTAVGVAIGGLLIWLIGTDTTVLWALLPVAILLAGIAPAAISFAAGQAAFTVVLVILFNIIAPAGWTVGLVRIEDVAIGFAVSLAVGLLFWPFGSARTLRQELGEAYASGARYLEAAVEFGVSRCDRASAGRPEPVDEAEQSAAAARRLDDAFRTFLAERAGKGIALANITGLVDGVAGLRLAADAVLELWRAEVGEPGGDRAAARTELLGIAAAVSGWYEELAESLLRLGEIPPPLEADDGAAARLVAAVDRDLRRDDGRATVVGARVVWTGDHLDAARRLQASLGEPAGKLIACSQSRFGLPARRVPAIAPQRSAA
jgi:uncharacterized membrane protein YccC